MAAAESPVKCFIHLTKFLSFLKHSHHSMNLNTFRHYFK